jgi:uncharacterized coiled-coil protein SlyX
MEQKGIMKTIRENWAFVVCIVGVIMTFTTLKNDQGNMEKRITRAESQIEAFNPILLQLQTSMARVETTLEFIKQNFLNKN